MKLIVGLLDLAFFTISHALVNVAPGATGKYCSKQPITDELFDGDTNSTGGNAFSEKCKENANIKFQTVEPFYVHYFVIYRGKGPEKEQMKFLRLEMFMPSGYAICGEHHLSTFDYNVGIRINCPPRPKLQWFKIQSHVDEGLYLSEVEMYYLGDNAREIYSAHKGCFKSFTGDVQNGLNMTLGNCASACNQSYPYLAMKRGIECYCGSRFEDEDPFACNVRCSDSAKMCGGEDSYSVYMINFRLPYYEGCYIRTDLKAPVIEGDDMTTGKCLKLCETEKMAWLSKGNKCQCDSNMGDAKLRRMACTAPCKGDNNVMCGSLQSDIYSTWRGCFNSETHSLRCSDGFMCDGSFNGFGVCRGSCKDNFTGQHCLEKDSRGIFDNESGPTALVSTRDSTVTFDNESGPTALVSTIESLSIATLQTIKEKRKRKRSTKKKKVASESSRLDVINTSLCILNQFIIMLIRMNL